MNHLRTAAAGPKTVAYKPNGSGALAVTRPRLLHRPRQRRHLHGRLQEALQSRARYARLSRHLRAAQRPPRRPAQVLGQGRPLPRRRHRQRRVRGVDSPHQLRRRRTRPGLGERPTQLPRQPQELPRPPAPQTRTQQLAAAPATRGRLGRQRWACWRPPADRPARPLEATPHRAVEAEDAAAADWVRALLQQLRHLQTPRQEQSRPRLLPRTQATPAAGSAETAAVILPHPL